ncbi:MAG TPA: prepilin-type N-terminal cleavage/methylation domain-containing protein [bacterium]|nr:prepilin-type N-terminal cleavage/methylation domain-containing protein [bacterium]HPP11383.1 prepilin-type N-terminal cleavage/methylation domain-containing protein [bacterium]
MNKNGLSLIELMVVMVAGAIALVAVTSLVFESYRDWSASRGKKSLQEEIDLASFTIKGVLEEADTVAILDSGPNVGTKIRASYADGTNWEKEFYPQGSNLIVKDNKTGATRPVINCLVNLSFQRDSTDAETVQVDLSGTRDGKTLQNSFVVYLRNKK